MKKKIVITLSIIMYIIAVSLVGIYFYIEFDKYKSLTPLNRIALLVLICISMYVGSIIVFKNINHKDKEKPLKINLIVWFVLYITLLATLTLFDGYFDRNEFSIFSWNKDIFDNYIQNYFNILPFTTIVPYIIDFIQGNTAPYIFIYNILGNLIALMPFAFFLPLLFKKQQNVKTFLLTTSGIVILIELMQFITLSGFCDIDDLILNVLGAYIMFKIIHIKSINNIIRNIFLLEHNQIDHKDLIKKVSIILSGIAIIGICILLGKNKYLNKQINVSNEKNQIQVTQKNLVKIFKD